MKPARRLLATLTVTGAALAGSLVVAPTAQADTPGCVSTGEYRAVKGTHYTKHHVHAIFDTIGHLEGPWTWGDTFQEQTRYYRKCSSLDDVFATYRRHLYWTAGADSHLVWSRWRLRTIYLAGN